MSKTILVVDDSMSVRQVVGMSLQSAGFRVLEAVDGRDALNKCNGERINLIITDVNMPNMDGISFVTELKKIAEYKFTPVIMLTTEGSDNVKAAGKAAGVKAWMVKPFKAEQMLDAVNKLI
jgi:two-component system chemotaxis response regulator CheY